MWVEEEMRPCIRGFFGCFFFLRACRFAFPTIYFEELISKGASGECLCF